MRPLLLLLPVTLAAAAFAQTDCSSFNKSDSPVPWAVSGSQEHKPGGYHEFDYTMGGKCSYTGTTPGAQCGISCSSSASGPADIERGALNNPYYTHYLDEADNEGYAQAPAGGSTISCQVTVAATVRSCLLSCAVSISFNASQNGVGASVNFPSDNIFARSSQLVTTCPPQQLPPQQGGGGCSSGGCCQVPTDCYYDGSGLSCDFCGCTCYQATPIIIDTTGHGFHLTSAQSGVLFDFLGKGLPNQLAWTEEDSGNGFLALDRNGNGRIDNGSELFGNLTPQPKSSDPNGYRALAEFDKPENGGNGDGIIDWRDAVYEKLVIWIDANHDGVSQPEELHSLPSMGVYSIGLQFKEELKTDQYGNKFRYRGVLNPDPLDGTSRDGRYTYDVYFAGAPSPANLADCQNKKKLLLDPLTEWRFDPLNDSLR